MSLKASFFNKSIIKSDLKRFWWISVLNALTVFFFGLFPFLNSSNNYVTTGKFSESSFASSVATLTYMWDGIFALLTVALLFIYLNHSGSVAVMHGLPLKRKNLYFSHMLSGACLLVAPLILNFGILFLFRLSDSIAKVLPVKYILIWAYIYFVYMIVVFSFTSLVAMITGSTIANIIFTAIFGLVPVAIEYFLVTFIREQVYGCMPLWDYFTTRWLYLNYDAMLTYKALIYLVLVILFVYLAVVLYNKRPLEANGEVVAFKVLRPLFIYGVALGSGMLGYLYFSKIISGNVFFLLPFGIIGIIIAWMLARKSFSLRGVQKPIIVFTLAVLVLFVFVHFDLTGYEKRVPELADVESVRIDDSVKLDKEQSKIYFGQKGFITYDQSYDPGLKSEADVKNVIFLHEYKIAHREKSTSARTIPIVYTLKNGKVLKRQYSIDPIKDAKYLKPLYETKEMRGFRYALTDGTAKVITRVDLYDDRLCGGTGISYSGENNENVKALTEALKKDLLSLPYEEDTTLIDRASSPCTYLCFSYYKKGTLDSGEKASIQDLLRYPITETYYITDSYKNTMALLEKMGLFNGILKAGDITEIGINNYKNESINYAYNCVLSTGTECMYKIADKKDIDEIFDFAVNSYKVVTNNTQDTGNLELTFVSKYGTVFTKNIYCDTKLWPKALKDALGK